MSSVSKQVLASWCALTLATLLAAAASTSSGKGETELVCVVFSVLMWTPFVFCLAGSINFLCVAIPNSGWTS